MILNCSLHIHRTPASMNLNEIVGAIPTHNRCRRGKYKTNEPFYFFLLIKFGLLFRGREVGPSTRLPQIVSLERNFLVFRFPIFTTRINLYGSVLISVFTQGNITNLLHANNTALDECLIRYCAGSTLQPPPDA